MNIQVLKNTGLRTFIELINDEESSFLKYIYNNIRCEFPVLLSLECLFYQIAVLNIKIKLAEVLSLDCKKHTNKFNYRKMEEIFLLGIISDTTIH